MYGKDVVFLKTESKLSIYGISREEYMVVLEFYPLHILWTVSCK